MFAIIAAIIFGLTLLLDLINQHIGSISYNEMLYAGLMFFALHFAYTGGWRRR